jgi:heme/copper-type cytochrome/quinol oxidase subunit 2
MDQNTVNAIEKLASALGKTGADVIQCYMTWYIVSSILWGILGVTIIFLGSRIKSGNDEDIGNTSIPAVLIKWVVIAIGLLLFFSTLVNFRMIDQISGVLSNISR